MQKNKINPYYWRTKQYKIIKTLSIKIQTNLLIKIK